MRKLSSIVILLLFSFFSTKGFAEERKWPRISEFTFTIGIFTKSERIHFEIPLVDEQGNTIYTLFGTGGSDNYLDHLSAKDDINYVGPLQIRLVEGTKDSEGSLLSEDDSPPWHTRGQVHSSQLVGACGKYPEYGVLRHFRLRGFELTLQFLDIETDKNGKPVYFNLKISLRTCPECTSAQTERPGYLSPYREVRNCKTVLKGKDPIMRRNKAGSWYEEK